MGNPFFNKMFVTKTLQQKIRKVIIKKLITNCFQNQFWTSGSGPTRKCMKVNWHVSILLSPIYLIFYFIQFESFVQKNCSSKINFPHYLKKKNLSWPMGGGYFRDTIWVILSFQLIFTFKTMPGLMIFIFELFPPLILYSNFRIFPNSSNWINRAPKGTKSF